MTNYVRTNLNYCMKIKLTETGQKIWKEYFLSAYRFPDAEGFLTLQIHEVMKLFGSHIVMGLEPPFETTIHIATEG